MTLSVLMYALMFAACVALAGVLAFDAVTAALRWAGHRRAQPARAAQRRPTVAGARPPRAAATKS
jgi:hypothetical protein